MKKLILILFVLTLVLVPYSFSSAAAVPRPVKILIVPGHDPDYGGAIYKDLKERDMNVALGTRIYNILKKDKRFEVYITRDWNGYTKTFSDYFTDHRDEIIAFKNNAKEESLKKMQSGIIAENEDNVDHNSVNEDTAVKLYGINKWADENDINAILHIHFNDYPRADTNKPGDYKGFVIYIPDSQRSNAIESKNLAGKIFKELRKKYTISTYEKEKAGLVEDQTLIALGSFETLNSTVRSILVEYGYIYRFPNQKTRLKFYDSFARLTVTGIKNYFFAKK